MVEVARPGPAAGSSPTERHTHIADPAHRPADGADAQWREPGLRRLPELPQVSDVLSEGRAPSGVVRVQPTLRRWRCRARRCLGLIAWAVHHVGMNIAGPIVAFCFGLLFFGGAGALAVNYRGFAVAFARRAEQSARSVGIGQQRLPHPMDEHDRVVFARIVGGVFTLIGVVLMASVIGGVLGLVDVSYGTPKP